MPHYEHEVWAARFKAGLAKSHSTATARYLQFLAVQESVHQQRLGPVTPPPERRSQVPRGTVDDGDAVHLALPLCPMKFVRGTESGTMRHGSLAG